MKYKIFEDLDQYFETKTEIGVQNSDNMAWSPFCLFKVLHPSHQLGSCQDNQFT